MTSAFEAIIEQGTYRSRGRERRRMTRSKELRRIQDALVHRDEEELRWALAECELRKRFSTRQSGKWYQIEKQIRSLLAALDRKPD